MSSRTSKKGNKIILFVILVVIILLGLFFFKKAKTEAEQDSMFSMSSNSQRVKFLNEQGWIVKPDPVKKEEIIIPSEVNETYAEYLKLLNEQGFNIKEHMGKDAMMITYEILNYPDFPENVVANMIILDDKLIGGDVSLNEEGGFVVPLISDKTKNELMEQNTATETVSITDVMETTIKIKEENTETMTETTVETLTDTVLETSDVITTAE